MEINALQFTFYWRATNPAFLACNQPSLTDTVLAASRALLCPHTLYQFWQAGPINDLISYLNVEYTGTHREGYESHGSLSCTYSCFGYHDRSTSIYIPSLMGGSNRNKTWKISVFDMKSPGDRRLTGEFNGLSTRFNYHLQARTAKEVRKAHHQFSSQRIAGRCVTLQLLTYQPRRLKHVEPPLYL